MHLSLFFDFPDDPRAWQISDEYMFGPDLLVAPVLEEGVCSRAVYLPAGTTWTEAYSGKTYEGGAEIQAEAPIDIIPVFVRDGKQYDIYTGWNDPSA